MVDNNRLPPTCDKRCGTFAGYKAHQYRKENACSDCRKACANNAKRQRNENPEKHKNRISIWRKNNKDVINAKHKIWRDNNKERYKAKTRKSDNKRRALKRNNYHAAYTQAEVLALYGTNCHICNEPIDLTAPRQPGVKGWEYGLHLDHVLPLSSGGADNLENVKPAHGICNLKKHY